MCTYCFIADWMHKYVPDDYPTTIPVIYPTTVPNTIPVAPYPPYAPPIPVKPIGNETLPWSPWTPYLTPVAPISPLPAPWTQEQLDEALEILRKVKEMEDALGGCPCEDATKLDFLKEIQARLDRLKEQDESSNPHPISE